MSAAQERHAFHTLINGEKITARLYPFNDGKPMRVADHPQDSRRMVMSVGDRPMANR